MEGLIEFLIPLTRLLCYLVLIVLFFAYIVRPLLNYLIINREIEQRKKIHEESVSPESIADEAGSGDTSYGPEGDLGIGDGSRGIGGSKNSDKDVLNRLAASNPEKAGDLVKQWVNRE